jgi:hypothetical protein
MIPEYSQKDLKFKPGDKVCVSSRYHWVQGAIGTIAEPPEFARRLAEIEAPWEGWHRYVEGTGQPIEFYWVWFDEPQLDADGDGPYRGGEIDASMLEFLSRS